MNCWLKILIDLYSFQLPWRPLSYLTLRIMIGILVKDNRVKVHLLPHLNLPNINNKVGKKPYVNYCRQWLQYQSGIIQDINLRDEDIKHLLNVIHKKWNVEDSGYNLQNIGLTSVPLPLGRPVWKEEFRKKYCQMLCLCFTHLILNS
jgi:hypothetical protein